MKPDPAPDSAVLPTTADLRMHLPSAPSPSPIEVELRRLHRELEVRQLELERQNRELRRAKDEIEYGLERYTELFHFAPVGYFNLTADGTIRLANLTCARLLGGERAQELFGRHFGSLVAESDRNIFGEFLGRLFRSACHETCELALATEGRPPRFVRLEGKYDPDGERCRVAMLDITERMQAETKLRESEAFVRDVINSLSAHVAVLDAQGVIVAVNQAWQRFAAENAGNETKVSVGANYLEVCESNLDSPTDLIPRAALQGIRAVIHRTLPSFSLEYPCHSPTEERWFLMKVQPLGGNRKGVVIAHENITELKQLKQQLH